MDNIEQAAILLLGMGEEYAASVLKHMSHKQVEKLVEVMQQLSGVSETKVISVLNNFLGESSRAAGLGFDSEKFLRKTLTSAIGSEKAESLLSQKLNEEKPFKGLELLNWQHPRLIKEIIEKEHPQVIAIIFSYLDSEKAAQVLSLLPKERHVDIVKRLTNIGPVSPLALETLAVTLEKQITENPAFKDLPSDGIETAAEIVNFLDSELENEIISGMSSMDESLTQKIQDKMFPFERLAQLDKRSLQTLLRNIANDVLVLALKGADAEMRKTFFQNMSERAADMIKDDLEAMGPVQVVKVEGAQKEIVATAQRLAKEGQIMLQAGDDVIM